MRADASASGRRTSAGASRSRSRARTGKSRSFSGTTRPNVVLRAQRRERRHVGRIGDARDDDASVAVVQGRCERIRVDAERDRAGGAERADDVDPLADGREEHDHDARAYSEDFGARLRSAPVPEPIRILRVIARLQHGRPAIHVSNLAAGLETRGYHTTLVAGSLPRGEDSMAYVAERLGVSVVDVPEMQREVAFLHDARSIRRLTAIMRAERPHILHTHTAKAGALARAAALVAGNARPPIVVHTFHGHVLKGYFGPGSHRVLPAGRAQPRPQLRRSRRGEPGGPGRARGARGRARGQVRGDPARHPTRRATRRRDGGSRLPPAVRDREGRVRRRLGRADDRGEGHRHRPRDRPRDPRSAVSTRCSAWSETALTASASSSSRYDLGIARSTYFVGYQEEIAGYYRLFDAFLLPSVTEGTPVSAIEALASGTPVVATRVGGVPDVVTDGTDGFLFEPGDTEAAADRLAELARDPGSVPASATRVARSARERYSVERLVDDVDRLYRSLLAAKGSLALAAPAAGRAAVACRGRARAACGGGSRGRRAASGSRRTRRRARCAPPTGARRGRAPAPTP